MLALPCCAAMILFQSWVPASGGAYVASCLAIIALAVAVQASRQAAAPPLPAHPLPASARPQLPPTHVYDSSVQAPMRALLPVSSVLPAVIQRAETAVPVFPGPKGSNPGALAGTNPPSHRLPLMRGSKPTRCHTQALKALSVRLEARWAASQAAAAAAAHLGGFLGARRTARLPSSPASGPWSGFKPRPAAALASDPAPPPPVVKAGKWGCMCLAAWDSAFSQLSTLLVPPPKKNNKNIKIKLK